MDESWLPYLYWMDTIPDFGRVINRRLLEIWQSPIAIYNIEETQIRDYVKPKQYDNFVRAKKRTVADITQSYNRMLKQNIAFIPYMHPGFPNKLRQIPDAPFAIYVAGSLPETKKPAVAIIGARVCSEYGRYMARKLASDFAKLDIAVISGMAKGIDGIGQRAVLEAGGKTYGVLGCGVDICYPVENRDIYQNLWAKGGLISEYPPGMQPLGRQFPPRNRIISALADAIIVIEAKRKSGTMITVDMALEQGKEVYALPGRCTDLLSEGCNLLIRQGAGVAVSAQDIAEDLYRLKEMKNENTERKLQTNQMNNYSQIKQSKQHTNQEKKQTYEVIHQESLFSSETAKQITKVQLSPLQTQILSIMELEIRTIDEILDKFRIQFPGKNLTVIDMMCEIMSLQMLGIVQKTNGGFFRMEEYC